VTAAVHAVEGGCPTGRRCPPTRGSTTWGLAGLLGVALAITSVTGATASVSSAATDLTGVWELHTAMCPFPGECPMRVGLVQTGNQISGSASGAPIEGVTGQGRVKFIVLEGPSEDDFTVTGIVSADGRSIRGQLQSGIGGTGAMIAVRTP